MAKDILQQLVDLKTALEKERNQLESRLAAINKVLGSTAASVTPTPGTGRGGNAFSLREAVLRVTAGRPLTRGEILTAVQDLGYKFNTTKPLNSLGTLLYNKSLFRNEEGRFSPARGESPKVPAASVKTRGQSVELLRKRKLSKAGRARLAAAAKARWAKIKQSGGRTLRGS